MPEAFERALMESNSKFKPSISLLNKEYSVLTYQYNQFAGQNGFTSTDLVKKDFKGQQVATYGDSEQVDGKLKP
eukprot:CAMPEP_0168611570 /NCGR_PEP_ID=MMETSP0449_2-20121227/2429_1 /TAXON_ID=1082188 /ORGANISM="Strombidium rassoulzadegani, Strain ras09" /LENGTH=73 /DNA_ID=CAMNT_0008652027 /DNA_START=589 /DNA_END=810 /DNA_ORIENTATION=-